MLVGGRKTTNRLRAIETRRVLRLLVALHPESQDN